MQRHILREPACALDLCVSMIGMELTLFRNRSDSLEFIQGFVSLQMCLILWTDCTPQRSFHARRCDIRNIIGSNPENFRMNLKND